MKRPKVRYVVLISRDRTWGLPTYCVSTKSGVSIGYVMEGGTRGGAERLAAALNLHEAVRRGELKVVEPCA